MAKDKEKLKKDRDFQMKASKNIFKYSTDSVLAIRTLLDKQMHIMEMLEAILEELNKGK